MQGAFLQVLYSFKGIAYGIRVVPMQIVPCVQSSAKHDA